MKLTIQQILDFLQQSKEFSEIASYLRETEIKNKRAELLKQYKELDDKLNCIHHNIKVFDNVIAEHKAEIKRFNGYRECYIKWIKQINEQKQALNDEFQNYQV